MTGPTYFRTDTPHLLLIPSAGYAHTDGPSVLGDEAGNSARFGLDVGLHLHTTRRENYESTRVYDQAVTLGVAYDNSTKVNAMWRGWNQVHIIGALAYGVGFEADVEGLANGGDASSNMGVVLEAGFLTAIPPVGPFAALSLYLKPSFDGHVEGGVKLNVPLEF